MTTSQTTGTATDPAGARTADVDTAEATATGVTETADVTAAAGATAAAVPADADADAGPAPSTSRGADSPLRNLLPSLVIDVAAPIGLYYGLRAAGLGMWTALLLGMVPPTIRAGWTLTRRRRIDGLALFTLTILLASVLVSFVTGSPRLLMAKDGWTTGLAGIWILATLARRPFVYQFVCSFQSAEGRATAETCWNESATYRRTMRGVTSIWGVGMLLDAGVRVVLAYTLPIGTVPLVGGLQFVAVYLVLQWISQIYGRRASVLGRIAAESGVDLRK